MTNSGKVIKTNRSAAREQRPPDIGKQYFVVTLANGIRFRSCWRGERSSSHSVQAPAI